MHYCKLITLGPAYNKFGNNEHSAIASRFLCIKIIDCHVKQFSYSEHPPTMPGLFCIVLLVVSGTNCTWLKLFCTVATLL